MSALTVHDLHVQLGDKPVLRGIDLALAPGQVTVIIGPNGAGKSTLLTRLAGLAAADRGEVRLGDQLLRQLPARTRGQRIGYLPQSPEVVWPVTVSTLVGLGRTPFIGARGPALADTEAVARAMKATETDVLESRIVETLSGGERARVLLARAIAGEPEWLLADEPMAGLDPSHQLDAAVLFQRMAHADGRGVVITLHDLHLAARIADRIVVLAEGRILHDGAPAAALAADVLRAAYGVRARSWPGEKGPLIEILERDG